MKRELNFVYDPHEYRALITERVPHTLENGIYTTFSEPGKDGRLMHTERKYNLIRPV